MTSGRAVYWAPSMSPRVRARPAAPLGRLLSTKITRPAPRPGRVSRPRLTALLDAGLERPLTLVSAPAGFGKTTLVADWLESPAAREPNVAWLALDEGDNDPARFWIYVVGALEAAQPGLPGSAAALLRVPEVALLDDVVE